MENLMNRFGSYLYLCGFFLSAGSSLMAQDDSSFVNTKGASSIYLGVGPVFAFSPVFLSYNATVVFNNSWGVSADFMRYSERNGTLGQGEWAFSEQRNLVNLRLVKEIPLGNPNFRLQMALGPSLGISRTRYWSDYAGVQPQMTDHKMKTGGFSGKIGLVAKVNDYIGISGGIHMGYTDAFSVNGPEVSLLIGKLGTYAMDEAVRRRPLESFSNAELAAFETKYRRQAGWAFAVGSIFTAAAVASNVLAVAEYHRNDSWSRLGGTAVLLTSHLAIAPVGTSLLVLGFTKRGKANRIRARLNPQ